MIPQTRSFVEIQCRTDIVGIQTLLSSLGKFNCNPLAVRSIIACMKAQRIITLCVALASAVVIYLLFHRSTESLVVAVMVAGSGIYRFFKSSDDDGPTDPNDYERRE